MKRAKVWSVVAEDARMAGENTGETARVLTAKQKKRLFGTAASKDEWMVGYCAAVLAVSTTCRGVELKHLRGRDVDLFERTIAIRRSKNQAGHRTIPLNGDAIGALAQLRRRAEGIALAGDDHFVFPACERNRF